MAGAGTAASDSAVTNAADSAQNDSAQAEGESVASVTKELDIAWVHMSPAGSRRDHRFDGRSTRLGGTGNVVALTMAEHHGVRKRGNILIENILLENPGITLLEDHNIDGHADAIEAIRRGDPMIATVAQAFEVMGEKCAQLIQSIVVEGKPVADVVQVTTLYVDAPLLTDMNLPDPGEPAYLTADFYE